MTGRARIRAAVAGVAVLALCAVAFLAAGPGKDSPRSGRDRAARTPVIIELNVPLLAESQLSRAGAQQQRDRLRTAGERVLRNLQGAESQRPARVLRTLPYVMTTVDATELKRLRASPDVKRVQRDRSRTVTPTPRRATRRVLASAAAAANPHRSTDYDTGAASAWAAGFTGGGLTAAVLGTGIEYEDPWFGTATTDRLMPDDSLVVGEACFSTYASGYLATCVDRSHGPRTSFPTGLDRKWMEDWSRSHQVAAMISGAEARLFGFPVKHRGIATDAGLYAINVASTKNRGELIGVYEGDVLAGLDDVIARSVDHNIFAVNISFEIMASAFAAGSCDSKRPTLIQDAINRVIDEDITVVTPAGDRGEDPVLGNKLQAPACYSKTITVGATDEIGRMAAFSQHSDKVDVLARGVQISGPTLSYPFYDDLSGTSLSAAFVTGAALLYKEKYPNASPAQIKKALKSTGPVTEISTGKRRHKLAIDQLLRLDRLPVRNTNPDCVKIEFRPAAKEREHVRYGFVRLTCAPTRKQPDRLAVLVDGPGTALQDEVVEVPIRTLAYYGENLVKFGPVTGVTTRPGERYRVCYLLFSAENLAVPAMQDCDDFKT